MGVLKLPGFPGTPVPTEKGPSPRRSRKPSAFAAPPRAPDGAHPRTPARDLAKPPDVPAPRPTGVRPGG